MTSEAKVVVNVVVDVTVEDVFVVMVSVSVVVVVVTDVVVVAVELVFVRVEVGYASRGQLIPACKQQYSLRSMAHSFISSGSRPGGQS